MRNIRRTATVAVALLATLFLIPAAAQAKPKQIEQYVALGDSYSSGAGAGAYSDAVCQRSNNAYPELLADELGAELSFVACGGAVTDDVLAGQVDALSEETDLVTIGIGGNDIGWTEAIAACITPFHDCTPEIEEAERKATEELPAKLDAVYAEIAERSPKAEVYVLGYPRLFAARNTCDALGSINIAEQERMNQGADLLSDVIEEATGGHSFTYVDVRDGFEGHAICDTAPWLHGFTVIDVPYHPNVLGQRDGYYAEMSEIL
ncbi:SGNH/GDSL hydrolase family protein [Glycomyces buryatensis]|uniref:SGNH/GDSL hydrolase family protein n=1 Tax=Glycomyces buryatensis TaxID=2570927 RepID=A0A4S8Q3A6_9ACTN|nr:SGNH/GDSL hydrolase family protein [Glycomyces buryatensis]THV37005.1 SGNH/GDSL hydrolase family protein [Glycomyces buryatensis]